MTSVVLTIRRLLTIDKTCSHECYRAQEPWDRLQGSNIGPGMFALWTFLTRSKISEHKLQILNCVRSKSHFNRMTKTHTHKHELQVCAQSTNPSRAQLSGCVSTSCFANVSGRCCNFSKGNPMCRCSHI